MPRVYNASRVSSRKYTRYTHLIRARKFRRLQVLLNDRYITEREREREGKRIPRYLNHTIRVFRHINRTIRVYSVPSIRKRQANYFRIDGRYETWCGTRSNFTIPQEITVGWASRDETLIWNFDPRFDSCG